MNILDNIIAWVNPEAAVRRESWRIALNEYRSYDAGNYSRVNSNWVATNQSGENTDRYERDIVRARARDLERNSDMMNSVISAFVRNIVGKGFILQAETDNEELNAEIEQLWRIWCKKYNCDVTGTQSLTQILRMCVRRKKVDGGVLIVKRFVHGGILPFKLQVFEVDELDTAHMATSNGSNRIVGGIEYNEYNAPVGYWIKQYSIDGMDIIDPVYIEAKDVIFYYSKKRPSQLREISDMSQTITRIRDANEFMSAVAMKQRVEACFSVFIKKTLPTQSLGRSSNGPAHQTYDGKMLAPGMIMELNAGDDVQQINPQGQATDAASFVKLEQRMIGAGQGLSYEGTSRDMSQSTYSSARQGLIEDSMTFAEEEELLLSVLDEIYETFIISAVLAGKLRIPGFWEDKYQYFRHTFDKPPKGWINPKDEATATQIALQTGQKTFKEVAAENGADWRKQIDDMCEVLEYAQEQHGVDLGGVIFGSGYSTTTDNSDQDADQDADQDVDSEEVTETSEDAEETDQPG